MRLIFLLLLLFSVQSQTPAQSLEIGAVTGFGRVVGENVTSQSLPLVGLSGSARLGGPEIKIDYEFIDWDRNGSNLHMIGVGWFIQSHQDTIRPFFQWGWTFGIQREFGPATSAQKFMGPALSGGFSIPVRERFFVRPELRWRTSAPGPMMFIQPSLSMGWRP